MREIDEKTLSCLKICVDILKEYSIEAKNEYLANTQDLFKMGFISAYYQIFLVLKNQAEVMGIPLDEINLQSFDPDRELMV